VQFLVDENLSPRLESLLREPFPGSVHVETLGLRGSDDATLWQEARIRGLAILTKDDDFNGRSIIYGAPPKVVHLRVGNVGTEAIVELLIRNTARINAFSDEPDTSLLVLP
jgi:predicted nuclease of predicted toxin-antitoxin system